MRTLILCMLALFLSVAGQATTYFVAANGSDNNNGTAQATPWQTIAKVNSKMSTFVAGDFILFRKGDIFQGDLILSKSGSSSASITFGAYGSGALPVLTGFVPVSGGWALLDAQKGIYESSAVSAMPTGKGTYVCTINGKFYPMGRFPNADAANKGWLSFDSHTSTSITDNSQFFDASTWTGAQVVARSLRYSIDMGQVASISNPTSGSTTFNFTQSSIDSMNIKTTSWANGWGYFLTNSPATLDQFGEWWYNPTNKKLRVCFAGNNPNLFNVQISAIDQVVEPKVSNTTMRDLVISGANLYGIGQQNAGGSNMKWINCTIMHNGINAVIFAGKRKVVFDSCTITDNGSIAFSMGFHDTDFTIKNSLVQNNGVYPQCFRRDDRKREGVGIYWESPGATPGLHVANCTVKNIGFLGIFFIGDECVVENNFVDTTNFILDDGGGIYQYSSLSGGHAVINHGDTIRNNVVLHSLGSSAGSGGTASTQGTGIYLDDRSNGTYVYNNTVAYSGYYGMYYHNAYNVKVFNNNLHDNVRAAIAFQDDGIDNAGVHITGINLKHNQIQCMKSAEWLYYIASDDNNFSTMGAIDSNYLSQPFGSTVAQKNWFKNDTHNYTNADWGDDFNFDQHSFWAQKAGAPWNTTNINNIRFEYSSQVVDSYIKFCGKYYSGLDQTQYRYFAHLTPLGSVIMYAR